MAIPIDEDSWAFVPIGFPFPENPVRVKGEMNQYVALWYKHGKPVCGRAWNNGGVLECSFPYNGKELTGARDLGGEIQILTNPFGADAKESYAKRKFWYEWVPYKERNQPHLSMVRCGQAAPILIPAPGKGNFVGNVDLNTDIASFSLDKREEKKEGGLLNFLVICRNKSPPCPPPVQEDQWLDKRARDDAPANPVAGMGRPLMMEDGSKVAQFVCLWYKHGEPLMGRYVIDAAGKISATFGWDKKEFSGDVGSIQVLKYTSMEELGFEISWVPYKDAIRSANGFKAVHVADVAPCVIKTPGGHERLGQVKLSKEVASCGWGGKEEVYTGGAVQNFHVLCRRP